jgi:hypothetical protein
MADLSYTNKATQRRNANIGTAQGNGIAYKPIVHTSTIELAGSASGTTVLLARVPSNARIGLHSDVYWDDLATSGSPTLDIGIGPVDGNVTADPDALNDGLNLSSAASSSRVVKDIANVGKQVWEYVNGQSNDPGGLLDIYVSVKDAATNATGTISAEFMLYFD